MAVEEDNPERDAGTGETRVNAAQQPLFSDNPWTPPAGRFASGPETNAVRLETQTRGSGAQVATGSASTAAVGLGATAATSGPTAGGAEPRPTSQRVESATATRAPSRQVNANSGGVPRKATTSTRGKATVVGGHKLDKAAAAQNKEWERQRKARRVAEGRMTDDPKTPLPVSKSRQEQWDQRGFPRCDECKRKGYPCSPQQSGVLSCYECNARHWGCKIGGKSAFKLQPPEWKSGNGNARGSIQTGADHADPDQEMDAVRVQLEELTAANRALTEVSGALADTYDRESDLYVSFALTIVDFCNDNARGTRRGPGERRSSGPAAGPSRRGRRSPETNIEVDV